MVALSSSQAARLVLLVLSFVTVGRGQVTCTCDTPNKGAGELNHFTCTDGSFSARCSAEQACVETQAWRFEDVAIACKAPNAWPNVQVSIGFNFFMLCSLALWWLALLPKMVCRVWPLLSQSLQSWLQPCRDGSDETDKRIAHHVAQKRLERLKLVALPALYPLPILVMHSLFKALKGSFESGSTILDISVVGLTFEGVSISVLCLFAVTWPKLADRVLTLNRLDAFLMLIFVGVGCHTIPCVMLTGISEFDYQKAFTQSSTAQIVVAMCLANVYRVGLVNVINFCMQVAVVYYSLPGNSAASITVSELRDASAGTGQSTLWRVVWNAFFIQLVSVMASELLRAEARALIGEKEASRSQTTARNLLSVMCDSVVALHKDLTFRGDCSRLMASLMMDQNISVLDPSRRSFLKYIADEDENRFQEFIEAQEGAGLIHVHLLDSFHRKVAVQVFHTKWIDADNEVNYLLGIQEEREVDHFQNIESLPKDQGEKRREAHEGPGLNEGPDCRPAVPPEGPRKPGSSSQSNSSRVSIWEGVSCTLRLGLQMQVMQQSEECQALFGFDDSLLPRVDDATQMNLVDWLSQLHMRKIHQRRGVASFGEVAINSSAGICYKATLSAKFVPMDEASPMDTALEITLSPPSRRRAPTERELVQFVVRHSSEQRRLLRARAASLPAVRPRSGVTL